MRKQGPGIVFEAIPADARASNSMMGRLPGLTVGFAAGAVELHFLGEKTSELRIDFEGAAASANPKGDDLAASQTNYLLGNDPEKWRTHVANYNRVAYKDLYPGIDAVFYGSRMQLEHDFLVAPGADYRQIKLRLSKQAHATLSNDGDLLISLSGSELRMHKPVIYQEGADGRQSRDGSFRMLPTGEIGFTVASYDPGRTLIIDPVLSFATYTSPKGNLSTSFIATDKNGITYLTGWTPAGYPTTSGAFPGCKTCAPDALVTYISKFSADGTELIYSTLIGGHGGSQPNGIAVDANGNTLVAGLTGASDFPTKNGQPVTPSTNGSNYEFVTSLSADGISLNYSTLLGGGSQSNLVAGIAVDATGNAYVAGNTTSTSFVTTPGALNTQITTNVGSDVFLYKFGPTGTLMYSALLGQTDSENPGAGPLGATVITVDTSGNAYVGGQAGTLWTTTTGVYIPKLPGSQPYAAPFVTKISSDGKNRIYSTFLEYAYSVSGIGVLPNGYVFAAGSAAENNYPTTPGAYQPGSSDGGGFLAELNATGSALVYATLFADSYYQVSGMALDPNGDIWLSGRTGSPTFPLIHPLQSVFPFPSGNSSMPGPASVVSQFDPTGKTLKFSTFLGGPAIGMAESIAVDGNHRAHVSGEAVFGMYTTPGSYLTEVPRPAPGYEYGLFPYVAMIDSSLAAPALCVSPNVGLHWYEIAVGTYGDLPLSVTNCGTQPLTISSTFTGASLFTIPSATNGCKQSIAVGASCNLTVRYTPVAAETDASTLTLQSNASMTEAVLPLIGTGVVPKLVVQCCWGFEPAVVGQSIDSAYIVIENGGGTTLLIDKAKTTVDGDFSVPDYGGCGLPLSPGDSCALSIRFSPTLPGTRNGTIRIASNDPANPVTPWPLQSVGYAAALVPEVTWVATQMVPAGVAQTTFNVSGFGFQPNSVVRLNGVPQKTTYASSTWLVATLAATSIPANSYGEIALTVTTPAPGGGVSAPYLLTEYRTVPTENAFLLYEPVTKLLYASVPASAATNPNTILPINPVTASSGTPLLVGKDPNVLAASSDGAYLYVALNGDHAIQRVNLATKQVDRTFQLPLDPTNGSLGVRDMHVVPGKPTEVAATLFMFGVSPAEDGIALFNDAGLVNWIPGSFLVDGANTILWLDNFTFTSDPTMIYSQPFNFLFGNNFFTQLSVSSAGIAYSKPVCCETNGAPQQGSGDIVVSDGTLLYTNAGDVWDPATKKIVKSYSVQTGSHFDSVVLDGASAKTYFLDGYGLYNDRSATTVRAYDQKTLAQTGSLSFVRTADFISYPTQLVRWGTNGFAARFADDQNPSNDAIFMFTSNIASASNLNPFPVASSLNPASIPAMGGDFTLSVAGSGFVPGSTVFWNGFPRPTTYVSSTNLTATIYASDIAQTGTAEIYVVSPGPGAGTSKPLPFTIGAAPPPAPIAVVSPASLAFPARTVGTASSPMTATLSNTGNAALSSISISNAGTNANYFSQTNNCGTSVAAGASCTVNVVFQPTAAIAATASLNIASNAPPKVVTLSGSGTPIPAPIAAASPSSLLFPAITIGTTSQPMTATLSNTGNAALSSIAVTIAGINANNFSQTNTCGTAIAAGSSCTINVVFQPVAAGSATASLNIASNASPQTLSLSGSGSVLPVVPIAVVSPTSLTFADWAVGTAAPPMSATFSNTGNAPLSSIAINLSGTNPDSFSQTNNCGIRVAAGASCTVNVVFQPAAAGALTASLNIVSNASPQSINLSGSGTQSAFVVVPPTGGTPSNSVPAGQPATYNLGVSPANGYTGTVVLSCSGLPKNAACTFIPPTLNLSNGTNATFTVTIATKAPQTASIKSRIATRLAFAAALFLLPWSWSRNRRFASNFALAFALLLAGAGLSSCGGGGSNIPPPVPPSTVTVAPGTYTIQVVVSDGTTTQRQPLTLVVTRS